MKLNLLLFVVVLPVHLLLALAQSDWQNQSLSTGFILAGQVILISGSLIGLAGGWGIQRSSRMNYAAKEENMLRMAGGQFDYYVKLGRNCAIDTIAYEDQRWW